jgi:MFS superfamily sulfate permease-like transporter
VNTPARKQFRSFDISILRGFAVLQRRLFKQRVRQTVVKSDQPLPLFIFDMEAISVIDITGLEALEEVRSEHAAKGIAFAAARAKAELREHLVRARRGSALVQRTFIRRYEARYSLR